MFICLMMIIAAMHHNGSGRARAATTIRGIAGCADKRRRILCCINHWANDAKRTCIQQLHDNARLVPGHPRHWRNAGCGHRLQHCQCSLVVNQTMLQVNCQTIIIMQGHNFSCYTAGNRTPSIQTWLACGPFIMQLC